MTTSHCTKINQKVLCSNTLQSIITNPSRTISSFETIDCPVNKSFYKRNLQNQEKDLKHQKINPEQRSTPTEPHKTKNQKHQRKYQNS